MSVQRFTNLGAATAAIMRDTRRTQRGIYTAIRKASRETRNFVARDKVPEAFGELRESIHAVDVDAGHSDVVADAPHAGAIELGSKPHYPPLDPLIRWVKLRGLQGLSKGGGLKSRRFVGPLTEQKQGKQDSARSIAASIRGKVGRKGAAAWVANAGEDPATVEIARAIQQAIGRHGSKPHHYMGDSVPQAVAFLDRFVQQVVKEATS